MLFLNHNVAFVDTVMQRRRDEGKLSDMELQEFASQLNVNTCDECDDWFDEEPRPHNFGMREVGAEYLLFPEEDI